MAIFALANTAGATAAFCPGDVGHSPSIDDNVNASDSCQVGSTNNDSMGGNAAQYQVNQDMMFGFDDWIFAEKAMDSDQDVDIGLSIVGDSISGQWAIDDIWNTMGVSSLMLVLKGGNADPDTYVSYLITPDTTAGDYLTPFINAGSGNPKDISHISAYFRTAARTTVPEPGSIVLIAIGLLAMTGILARRQKRAAQKVKLVKKRAVRR